MFHHWRRMNFLCLPLDCHSETLGWIHMYMLHDDEPDIKLWITPTQLGFCSHPLSLWPFVTHFMLHLNSISAACVARANAPHRCKTAIAAGMCTHVILCPSGEMWPWLSVPLLRMWLAAFPPPPPRTPPPATITQTKHYMVCMYDRNLTRDLLLWHHYDRTNVSFYRNQCYERPYLI